MKEELTILGFPLKVKISDLLPPFSGYAFLEGADEPGSIITLTFKLFWKVSEDGKSLIQMQQILTPKKTYYRAVKPSDLENLLELI